MAEETTTDLSVADSGSAAPAGATDQSSVQGATTPAQGASSADVTAQSPDPTQQTQESDPLANLPTAEQVAGMQTVSKEAFLSLRNEYDRIKPQLGELTTKLTPFSEVAERFQTPEEVASVVKLHDSLNKYSPGPGGQLIPDPREFVTDITTSDPDRSDYLMSHLAWSNVKDPSTGQPIPRWDAMLQSFNDADMQQHRARALQILGAVEPSQVPAPTWTPTQEELDKIVIDPNRVTPEEKALQDVYKKLSYEERDELKLGSPEYVKNQLRIRQQNEMLQANEERRVAGERQAAVQAEQRVEQEAQSAGDRYVETGFKEGFTNFAKHIYETYKPTDNDVVNRTEGAQVALAVVALSHPDTRFAAEQALKDMGVDPADLEAFNKARETYAQNGRQHGYLTHKKMRTNGDPSRDQQRLIALAKGLATKITKAKDAGFVLRAQARNDALDQATTARPVIGGQPPGNGRAAPGSRHPWQDI